MTYNELCESILTAKEELLKHKVEANSVTLNGRRYGMLVKNLPPNMKPTIFGMAVKADYAMPDDYDFLVQYEPPQPQTNYDRIISKTPEELAEWIELLLCPSNCPDEQMGEACARTSCDGCWLSWLKSPVEEGE